MANIKIAVLNQFDRLTDADINEAVQALQIQVHRDFAPVWGVDADLTFYPAGQTPPIDSWQLVVFDDTDQAGALGYHDLTEAGLPLGKVFAGSDKKYNESWTVTASHELLEMLGDPDVNLCALVQEEGTAGTLYAYEVCDACESDQYGYNITVDGNNILVSDFVFPSWFESFHPSGARFDFQNKITDAFQLLSGGYISIYNISAGSGWTQKNAPDTLPTYRMRAVLGSRREKRKTPRNHWLRSSLHHSPVITTKDGKKTTAATAGFKTAATGPTPANLTVTFNLGQGNMTAKQFRGGALVDQGSNTNGGTITLAAVQSGDQLSISGSCTGSATLSVDVSTFPGPPHNYSKGLISDTIRIL